MMLLRSMLRGMADSAIAATMLQRWRHDADSLAFWRASSNFVYTFLRDGKRYFLRFVHEEDNTAANIEAELDYVLYLLDRNYAAAAPVLSEGGRWVETIDTGHGRYFGSVFEQARGETVPMERMTDRHFEAWGRSVAALHVLSDSYAPPAGRARPIWREALAFVSSVCRDDPEYRTLLPALGQLEAELSALPEGPGHTGIVHYDYEIDNMFYVAEEDRYCAIDFDDAMVHGYVMDVARSLDEMTETEDEESARRVARFVAGYRSVRTLSDDELARLPLYRRFADLYLFARLRRSIRDFETEGMPEWSIRLRDKLQRYCGRILARYAP